MLGEAGSAQILYRSDNVHPRHQSNFRVFDSLDLLAEVGVHISDPHEKTTVLYSWSSYRAHGSRKQHRLFGKVRVADPGPDTDHPGTLRSADRGGVPDSDAIARGIALSQITAAGRRSTRGRRGR